MRAIVILIIFCISASNSAFASEPMQQTMKIPEGATINRDGSLSKVQLIMKINRNWRIITQNGAVINWYEILPDRTNPDAKMIVSFKNDKIINISGEFAGVLISNLKSKNQEKSPVLLKGLKSKSGWNLVAIIKEGSVFYADISEFDNLLNTSAVVFSESINQTKPEDNLESSIVKHYFARNADTIRITAGKGGFKIPLPWTKHGWGKFSIKEGLRLAKEKGEEIIEIIEDRTPTNKKALYKTQTDIIYENSFKSISTQQKKRKRPYHSPTPRGMISIEDIPSGQLTDNQIINLFSSKMVKGTHLRRGFSFERYFRLDGFLIEKRPQRSERSGYWRTNQDCLCIRFNNKREKCGPIIKENGKINQYRLKKSGSKVKVVTYEEFVSTNDDSE